MCQINNDVGVAIIFFNRPDAVKKVFESVAQVQPPKIFLIQDGPRNEKDKERVEACRKIVENIDWPCEVYKNYSEKNLGCGKRMSSGITWVFEHVEKAMILEDDCVPAESFYPFCNEMLHQYQDDERILMISGMNHWDVSEDVRDDYLFAMNGAIWGWATWKRAWNMFDFTASSINDSNVIEMLQNGIIPKRVAKKDIMQWKETNKRVTNGEKISYWAHQWRLVKFVNHNVCIVPKYNLVSNVGDSDATHPIGDSKSPFHYMKTHSLQFPLKHPKHIYLNYRYDQEYYKVFYPTIAYRIKSRLKRMFGNE